MPRTTIAAIIFCSVYGFISTLNNALNHLFLAAVLDGIKEIKAYTMNIYSKQLTEHNSQAFGNYMRLENN